VRALIWKDAIELYPNIEAMQSWLETEGVYNITRAAAHAHRALPWFRHGDSVSTKTLLP
jgi:hypothetical protein